MLHSSYIAGTGQNRGLLILMCVVLQQSRDNGKLWFCFLEMNQEYPILLVLFPSTELCLAGIIFKESVHQAGLFFLSNCTLGALTAPLQSGACTELLRANYVYDMEPGHTAATGNPPAKAQQQPYRTASGISL